MKTIGIAAHSAEGGALCFITACREGALQLGPHMHPTIVASAVPMGLSLPGWESDDHGVVAKFLSEGVQRVTDAGADFYICPDNTAHIVLEQTAADLPIPGLHIAEVVCHEIVAHGWKRVGLLGTRWTMTGPVYAKPLQKCGLECLIPDAPMGEQLNAAIFDEICQGIFNTPTTQMFLLPELRRRFRAVGDPAVAQLEGRQLPRRLSRRHEGPAPPGRPGSACSPCRRDRRHPRRTPIADQAVTGLCCRSPQ